MAERKMGEITPEIQQKLRTDPTVSLEIGGKDVSIFVQSPTEVFCLKTKGGKVLFERGGVGPQALRAAVDLGDYKSVVTALGEEHNPQDTRQAFSKTNEISDYLD